MKTSTIVALGATTIIATGAIGIIGSYIGIHNKAVNYESTLEKYNKSSMNTLSSYTLKLKEAANVPDKYTAQLKEVIRDTFSGRYGENGSQATMQWIKEQNIPIDSSMYVKLQTIIDSGRNEFKMSQDAKLEVCANYETFRNNFYSGFMVSFAGFPKKDINELCKIVIDQTTTDKFSTGIDSEIKF